MSRSISAGLDNRHDRFVLSAFVLRQIQVLVGLGIFLAIALAIAALSTWNVSDPSLSYASSGEPKNILGYPGAVFADLFMQFFGLASVIALLPVVAWGIAMISGRRFHRIPQRAAAWLGGAILASAALACVPGPVTWPLPTGLGGVFGDMILRFPALFTGAYPTGMFATVLGCIIAVPAVWLMVFSAGLVGAAPADDEDDFTPVQAQSRSRAVAGEDEEDEEREGPLTVLAGAAAHAWYTGQARIRRIFGLSNQRRKARGIEQPYDFNEDEFGTLNEPVRAKTPPLRGGERLEPTMEPSARRAVAAPPIAHDDDEFYDEDDDAFDAPRPAGILPDDEDDDGGWVAPQSRGPAAGQGRQGRVSVPLQRPKPTAFADSRPRNAAPGSFEVPPVNLLAEPKSGVGDSTLVEGVLEDFGVKGEIIHVRPGPVVTLYELEPAPGIKSSRVIGLADDIARSMSAIAARVAVVPGRNAIGIELPNQTREMVYLRELIANRDFGGTKAKLAMALGKTIGGEPVVADLAKMPHLLVAGTTGSGKSVAINTMILSLLYRMTPDQCRLIMIDPKMLELSVYDGIPHLLSPVVTDPKKAVVALKWTVREMEERYKKMSKIGVRNIDGFNSRVEQALAKGEAISRTVQIGFDRETGEALYETEEFDLQPMPYIVVIIDEMADLMMVAGKDIEGAVQRLAQMARAAGIHVIMATQRPSVDVITGTIKANFPTRISFQVTSKIDSRTILGEQGAEQLLGMGDMLYMAGGGRIQRVHGPFVSDVEVEEIVAYLKTQGSPQYLDAITEDDGEDGGSSGGPAGTANLSDSDDPYDQAVAVVLQDGKVSTSYIQRRLGIGYNRAASLIERMEKEGLIGPANHAGKREILVPTAADIIER